MNEKSIETEHLCAAADCVHSTLELFICLLEGYMLLNHTIASCHGDYNLKSIWKHLRRASLKCRDSSKSFAQEDIGFMQETYTAAEWLEPISSSSPKSLLLGNLVLIMSRDSLPSSSSSLHHFPLTPWWKCYSPAPLKHIDLWLLGSPGHLVFPYHPGGLSLWVQH